MCRTARVQKSTLTPTPANPRKNKKYGQWLVESPCMRLTGIWSSCMRVFIIHKIWLMKTLGIKPSHCNFPPCYVIISGCSCSSMQTHSWEQRLLAQWLHHQCSSGSAEGQIQNTWSAEYIAGQHTYICRSGERRVCLSAAFRCRPLADSVNHRLLIFNS